MVKYFCAQTFLHRSFPLKPLGNSRVKMHFRKYMGIVIFLKAPEKPIIVQQKYYGMRMMLVDSVQRMWPIAMVSCMHYIIKAELYHLCSYSNCLNIIREQTIDSYCEKLSVFWRQVPSSISSPHRRPKPKNVLSWLYCHRTKCLYSLAIFRSYTHCAQNTRNNKQYKFCVFFFHSAVWFCFHVKFNSDLRMWRLRGKC